MSENKLTNTSSVERVWQRQDEAKKMFIDHETFAEVEGLDVKTIRRISKEEGTTFEEFIVYAQKRSKQMSENEKHVVRNVTCNTYVESYDGNGLKETTNILDAKRYKNFKKADNVAFDLTDEDCVYKVIWEEKTYGIWWSYRKV